MFKSLKILILFLLSAQIARTQDFFLITDVPVSVEGVNISNPWAGGVVAPQFNLMDADFDGDKDLVIFDRYDDRILVFLWEDGEYVYSAHLASGFPVTLDNWMLLRDFNGDDKEDIFVSTPLGMEVYVNTGSAENGLSWRRYHDRSPGPSPLLTQGFNSAINLQLNATDIPAIEDIDSDGDLDILVFRFAGGSTVEWHRNFALERSGSLDSLQLERVTSGWGEFRECICGTFAFNNEDCPLISGRPLHEGGKTLTTIDLDGDGDRDALVSEETCDNIFLLENGGTPQNALMTGLLEIPGNVASPFFPAAFYDDFNHDGIKELVLSTNWPSVREPYPERINLFLNGGQNNNPEFQFETDRFIIESMIDLGGLSHPAFHDIDGDGDLDLIAGHYSGNDETRVGGLSLFRNTGTRTEPSFVLEDDDYLSVKSLKLFQLRPAISDLTGDGIPDFCFTASSDGLGNRLYVISGGSNPQDPFPGNPVAVFTELGDQDVVSIYDATGDGIPDALVGRVTGRVDLYRGNRSGGTVSFTFQESDVYGLGNDNFRGATFLAREDINGDGINDIFRSDSRGGAAWLKDGNIVNEWMPVNLYKDEDGMNTHRAGRDLAPVFANIRALNRDQLILGSGAGGIQIFEAFKSSVSPPEGRFLNVFPNPSAGRTNIFVRVSETADLRITDMSGRILGEYQNIPASINFPVTISEMSSGIYVITGEFRSGARISKKFIVIR